MRDSIAAIDALLKHSDDDDGDIGIDASNLILSLQGKVFKEHVCIKVNGIISRVAVATLQYAVRQRILELTLELEKTLPISSKITAGWADSKPSHSPDQVTKIYHQTIFGDGSSIVNSGRDTSVLISNPPRDDKAFIENLIKAGIPERDASDLADIMASEEPTNEVEPFGVRAKSWLVKNIKKAADGTWKVGISVATNILTEAASRYYYGLK